jgi:dihydroxy-acid dehydratase
VADDDAKQGDAQKPAYRSDGSLFTDAGLGGWVRRAFLRGGGFSPESLHRRPVIGICSSWSELNPCNMNLRQVAESVKRGVVAAGGVAMEFPTISLNEQYVAPTTMLLRNLMSMDVEEMINSSPIDGVVLLAGCDKTPAAQLMGAASADKPAIMLTAGPRSVGRFRGEDVVIDDFWTLAVERQVGNIDDEEWDSLEGELCSSVGVCNVMGTATTMAVLAEALGMALPGSAAIPATDARRMALAERTGEAAVELARNGVRPSDIITADALDNAIRVLCAVGGSTNAVIHLLALAGRLGIPLELDRFETLSDETPLVLGVKPSGPFPLAELEAVGGVPALLRVLSPLLARDAITVSGRTIGEVGHEAPVRPNDCLRTLEDPFEPNGGLAVLHGSLAPGGAVFKRSAAPRELWVHRGRALVYDGQADAMRRSMSPDLEATPDDILVLRNVGPVGAPGMPEIGMLPLPAALRAQGVRQMVCVTDGRMSGTQHGATALHCSPEAAVGGPIGLVRDGDEIVLDAERGVLDLLVDDEELARRASETHLRPAVAPRGYARLYTEQVTQAERGCDFDFLRAAPTE